MKVTICIPAFNEELIIKETLERIHAYCLSLPMHTWNIVVVDNCSTDATRHKALQVPHTTVIQARVQGKGAAVVEAANHDSSDVFCFIDADLSASPEAITGLLSAINNGADISIGSRLLDPSLSKRSFVRTLSSQLFNFFRKALLNIKVSDSQCGLKVMNTKGRNILRTCNETGWFFDMELLAKAEREGLVIKEIPIEWQEVVYPGRVSKLNVFQDGLRGLVAMIRIRRAFSKENKRFWQPITILLTIAAAIYISFFLWHTGAVNNSGMVPTALYYERGDSTGYVDMANSILRQDVSLVANDESARGLRTPGYPLFLAGVFTFSREPLVVLILQIIIAIGTIPFIFGIGKQLTSARISFWATLAYILYPTTTFLNTQILVETLYMFFTTLSLWLLLVVPPSWAWKYLAIGLTAGIAVLIRPSFLYIFPLMIMYTMVVERGVLRKLTTSLIAVIIFLVVLAPWLHANYRDYNHISLSTAGTYNILYVYIPQFLHQNTSAEGGWINQEHAFTEQTREAGYSIGSHRASSFENNRIKEELSGTEVEYFIFHIKRSVLTLLTSGIKMVNNELTELGKPLFTSTPWLIQEIYSNGISFSLIKNNLLAFVDAALAAVLTLLIPIGVLIALWRRDQRIWGLLLITSMIAITCLLAGPNGNARYRMPIQPYIFLLAFLSLSIISQGQTTKKIASYLYGSKIWQLIKEYSNTELLKGSKIMFFFAFWTTKFFSRLAHKSGQLERFIHTLIRYLPKPTFVIKNKGGIFSVDTYDDSMTICSEYFEKELRPWLALPTSRELFIDIGANRGIYSILACTQYGYESAYAFEPNLELQPVLTKNIALNKLTGKITLYPVALGADTGEATFTADPLHKGGGRITSTTRAMDTTTTVSVQPLDEVLNDTEKKSISFIKIDTEGYEHAVLAGMKDTLAKMSKGSVLMIESTEVDEIKTFLAPFRFKHSETNKNDHLFIKYA